MDRLKFSVFDAPSSIELQHALSLSNNSNSNLILMDNEASSSSVLHSNSPTFQDRLASIMKKLDDVKYKVVTDI